MSSRDRDFSHSLHRLRILLVILVGFLAVVFTSPATAQDPAPVFSELQPADGTVQAAAAVTLAGRVTDASSLAVDGVSVELLGEDFVAGPYSLVEGERSFTLVATSPGGVTTTLVHRVVLDTTPPTLSLDAPAVNAVVATPEIVATGTAADAHLARVLVNGAEASLAAGAFTSAPVRLDEGANVLRVRAEDAAGHATTIERSVVLDATPPALAITEPGAGTIFPEASLELRGTAADAHLDRVEVDGAAASLSADSWSATVSLAEGDNTFTVTAFDTLGQSSTKTLDLIRDSAAPSVRITAPAENLHTAAATTDVSGTVTAGATVTVNGADATVTSGTWSATGIELLEGTNRLIARASLGEEQGVHVREIVRDTAAPSLVAASPVEGTLLRGTPSIRLELSEPLAAPPAGAWRLELADTTAIAATAVHDGATLTVTPSAELPASSTVHLVLTSSLADLAGNVLAAPPTLVYPTAAAATTAAPSVDPPPRFLCAASWTLTGTAPAEAAVRVTGGAGEVETRAAADGTFGVAVPLLADRLHRLSVTATSTDGTVTEPSVVEIVQDCTAPTVIDVLRVGDTFEVRFSEIVDAASVPGTLTVSGVAGALSGTTGTADDLVTWTADAPLPAGDLALEVAADVRDRAGNALAFPYARVFAANEPTGFFAGTVIDDATGRPLAGARVLVTATDGVVPSPPAPEQTTDIDGRFQVAVVAGRHDISIVRPGYTPVFRLATTAAGQGTELFDPRLTPIGTTATVDAAGATITSPGGAILDIPASALAAATDVALTELSEQALPALLPFGWSPRGAAWIDVDTNLAIPATLALPVDAANGTLLTVAKLDLATLEWIAEGETTVAGGAVTASIDGLGVVVALEPDAGATAPPAALAGTPLGAASPPVGTEVTAASLAFDPEVILPTQTSDVTATYTFLAGTDAPSGLPLTLVVQEELTLLGGTLRNESPYEADLALYRAADGTPRSRFRLKPSETARSLPLQLGAEDVSVRHFEGAPLAGDVVDGAGGSVTAASGDRLDIPAGALAAATAVTLVRGDVADLPLAPPPEGTVDAVVDLDLGGAVLTAPASLSIALDPPPTAGETGLLLHVVTVDGAPRYRAVAALDPTTTGWTTSTIDPADLPFPGVREGGTYIALRLTAAHAFLRGTALDVDGTTPVVRAVVESPAVSWIQLTNADGTYVLPLPVGAADVIVTDGATGNAVTRRVTLSAPDERLDLDPRLLIVGPSVVQTSPTDGASVPAGIQPTVTFSEAVDLASVAAGVELLHDGAVIGVDLDVQGALVTVLPRATLEPGGAYTLRVGFGVRDLLGNGLSRPVEVGFTVQEIALPTGIDPTNIFLIEPDGAGQARILGQAGAVPSDHLVFVENLTSFASTESVQAAQDGSFEVTICASLGDVLLLHVLIPGQNEAIVLLGPFMTADLRSARVGAEAASFVTVDGIVVDVEAGSLPAPTWIRVAPRTEPATVDTPADIVTLASIDLDLGGVEAAKPLGLRIPGAVPSSTGPYLFARAIEVFDERAWMIMDLLTHESGTYTNVPAPPPASLTTPQAFDEKRFKTTAPEDFVTGPFRGGEYQVLESTLPMSFVAAPIRGVDMAFFTSWAGFAASVDAAVARILPGGVLLPIRPGEPFTLRGVDLSTGFTAFESVLQPPVGELVVVSSDEYGDTLPPYPTAGAPLRFYLVGATEGLSGDVAAGITRSMAAGTLTITGAPDAVSNDVAIRLVGLDDAVSVSAQSAANGSFTISTPATAGNRYLLAIGGRLGTTDWLDLSFSETLDAALSGLELVDGTTSVPLETSVEGHGHRVRLRPEAGWRSGRTYTLKLLPVLADELQNSWGRTLELPFDVLGADALPPTTTGAARDVARLGSLLFVAADSQGLVILDASDPANLVPYPAPGSETYPLALGDPVRGVEVDAHGRVIFVGGGVTDFGQLKILDPLALATDPIRGSTLLTDHLGGANTQLVEGLPRDVAVVSSDRKTAWRYGVDAVPAGLSVTPTSSSDLVSVTITGPDAFDGRPVTLHNRDRGTWTRVDAAPDGSYSLALEARDGELLELVRQEQAAAFVTLDGGGLLAVDLVAVDGSKLTSAQTSGQAVTPVLVPDDFSSAPSCPSGSTPPPFQPIAVDTLIDDQGVVSLALLNQAHGLVLLAVDPENLAAPTFTSAACAEVAGSSQLGGLAVAEDFPFDHDDDGTPEPRDLVLVTNSAGWLLVYDATDRAPLTLVGQVELPGPARSIAVDRSTRRALIAGGTAGVYAVSLDGLSTTPVDADADGQDDRVVETIAVAGDDLASILLLPELGMAVTGGFQQGVRSLALAPPRLALVADGDGLSGGGGPRAVSRLAPFGVPTAPEAGPDTKNRPGVVRLLMALPGGLATGGEIRLDLVSVGAGGLEIDPAGPSSIPDLPPTSLRDVVLTRQSSDPMQPGYGVFVSEPIVLLADLRASSHYVKTDAEKDSDLCPRCDLVAEGVVTAAEVSAGDVPPELLSGPHVAVRLPDAVRTSLEPLYGPNRLESAELLVESVRWDVSPSIRQEPTLNPSYGTGDVAPGTLLHSGEMTMASTDLALRGRGFDFAFTRTYRSGTVGGGPLGPGCDHNYRVRLRPLPNGDVEYYDGRGRRELFKKKGDNLVSPPGRFVDLKRTSSGYVLLDARRNIVRFDSLGRLVSIADANKTSEATGNDLRLFYDSRDRLARIEDTLDRNIHFDYNTDGLLTKITDFTTREFEYIYSLGGRLVEAKTPAITTTESATPAPLVTKYVYAPVLGDLAAQLNLRNNLFSATDPKDQTWLTLTFTDADTDGRAEEVTSQAWGTDTLTIAYDFTAGTASVTDRRSNVCQYEHNEAGQMTKLTDPATAVWTYAYDDEGLQISATLPLGRRTDLTYDPGHSRRSRGNLKVVTVTPDGRGANGSTGSLATSFVYETKTNQPTSITHPWGAVTTITRDDRGLPSEIKEAQGASEETITTILYNDYGQPTQITNPNGNVTEMSYFASGASRGYLEKVTVDPDRLSLTTSYETDARGNVIAEISPRNVRHERDVNALDWEVESRAAVTGSSDGAPALNYITKTTYDRNGNIAEVELPYGSGSGHTIVRSTYGILDELEEVWREIEPGDPETAWIVTRYLYDENLNVTEVIQPEGNRDRVVYNARNLVTSQTRGADTFEASTVHLGYNINRDLVSTQDGRGNVWTTDHDGYGRVMRRLDPLGNSAVSIYDNAHNLKEQEGRNALGVALAKRQYVYDLLNRPIAQTKNHWFENTALNDVFEVVAYDDASNVTSIVDPRSHTETRFYDAAERLAERTDRANNLTEYFYEYSENDFSPNLERVVETDIRLDGSRSVETRYFYDALDRLIRVEESDGRTFKRGYDARHLLVTSEDPDGNVTTYDYDGLNRRVKETRPESISVDYVYDKNSRLVTYRDAKGQETHYAYDALDRPTQTTYPDATSEILEYDANDNVTRITDPRGNVIDQAFDLANRMTARAITPAAGVDGVTSETYTYDGLDRLTSAVSGTVTTTFAYDSLSRIRSETTNGKTVHYEYDPSSNVDRLTYPSTDESGFDYTITGTYDELDRKATLAWLFEDAGPPLGLRTPGTAPTKAAVANPLVGYGYDGPYLVDTKSLGLTGLSGDRSYDATRRRLSESYTAANGQRIFDENLTWHDRNLKQSITRGDLNGAGLNLSYDGSNRLTVAERQPDSGHGSFTAGLPDRWSYTYDEAQNLLSRSEDTSCSDATEIAMPLDPSGRNRPSAVGAVTLTWDPSGNLKTKGDLTFHYDYRDRLIRVEHATNGTLAEYTYDAFNRRVEKLTGGQVESTVWSGWQDIETYVDGSLAERKSYGTGLDELVRLETFPSGTSYLPVYDHTGNLALLTDASGKPVERYEYSPFGKRWTFVDSLVPVVEQVRIEGGAVWLEISEEVDFAEIQAAASDGRLTLTNDTSGQPISVSVSQPVRDGRQAGRRLALTPLQSPPAGDTVSLQLAAGVLRDFFDNENANPFAPPPFLWPSTDVVVQDTAAPRLAQVCVKSGLLEVQFTEEPDLGHVTNSLLIDGQPSTWTLAPDRYTVTSPALSDGTHQLTIAAGSPLDLVSQSLVDSLTESFTIGTAQPTAQVVWSAPIDGRMESGSAAGNRVGFHGRSRDPETGLLYFRNRYYDPDLGRFVTTDPLGYQDGPSSYAFSMFSPYEFSDPMGLACTTEHGGVNRLCNPMDEMELSSQTSFLAYSWAVTQETVGNSLTEGLFLNVIADSPHTVLDPTLTASERWLGGAKGAGAIVWNVAGGSLLGKGANRLLKTRAAQWISRKALGSRMGQQAINALSTDMGALARKGNPFRLFDDVAGVVDDAIVSGARQVDELMPSGFLTAREGVMLSLYDPLFAARQMGIEPAHFAQLPRLRQEYVTNVVSLRYQVPLMKKSGLTAEQIAHSLHAQRRALGVRYKELTNPDLLERILLRNFEKYGDELGPSIEWLRARGKTWDSIIESASRPGGKDLGY